MTDKQIERLQAAVAALEPLLANKELTPEQIVAILMRDHGATLRKLAWTNTFRFGGLSSSCTADAGGGLLGNWRKLATLRLMAARAGGTGVA